MKELLGFERLCTQVLVVYAQAGCVLALFWWIVLSECAAQHSTPISTVLHTAACVAAGATVVAKLELAFKASWGALRSCFTFDVAPYVDGAFCGPLLMEDAYSYARCTFLPIHTSSPALAARAKTV